MKLTFKAFNYEEIVELPDNLTAQQIDDEFSLWISDNLEKIEFPEIEKRVTIGRE